jgi:hypothetical protein
VLQQTGNAKTVLRASSQASREPAAEHGRSAAQTPEPNMNIFECGAMVCVLVGDCVGAAVGHQYGITWLVVGALAGSVLGFSLGPLLGLVALLLAHLGLPGELYLGIRGDGRQNDDRLIITDARIRRS